MGVPHTFRNIRNAATVRTMNKNAKPRMGKIYSPAGKIWDTSPFSLKSVETKAGALASEKINLDRDGRPLFAPDRELKIKERFFQLVCVMARLRQECPWDRQQTPQSLKKYILEEAHEVLEAIEEEDWNGLKEELGDFLFQVLFQAQIQSEPGRFDICDVLSSILEKMIRRHPHVFENQTLTSAEVAANWERIKAREKGPTQGTFEGFTKGLPALLASYKIGKKAAKLGFDWKNTGQVLAKIEEELAELQQAAQSKDRTAVEEELGDLLFAVGQLSRKLGLEPEETLRAANNKFIRRFHRMERLSKDRGLSFDILDIDHQEMLWQEIKNLERAEHEDRSDTQP